MEGFGLAEGMVTLGMSGFILAGVIEIWNVLFWGFMQICSTMHVVVGLCSRHRSHVG